MLSGWFMVMGRQWKSLLVTSLIVFVPIGIAIAISFGLSGVFDLFELSLDPELADSITRDEAAEMAATFVVLWLLIFMFTFFGYAFVFLASAHSVARDFSGSVDTWKEAARAALRRLARAFGAQALLAIAGIAVVLAASLFIVGLLAIDVNVITVLVIVIASFALLALLIWLGTSFSLVVPVIGIEDVGIVESLRRSYRLVMSRWWPTLGYVLLITLITSAASQVASFVLVPLYLIGAFVPEMWAVVIGLAFENA